MWEKTQTDVLVVGAGPVGMLTALQLVEQGAQVMIVDEEWRTAVHNYACALHPQSLALLARLGLMDEVKKRGQPVSTVQFYHGKEPGLRLDLSKLPGEYPMVLVLPQSALEGLLEERLRRQGVKVLWNHRLSGLAPEGDTVTATIDKLGGTVIGYAVPSWEVMVQKRYQVHARFVVGADGHHSMVRQLCGIEYESLATPQPYDVYEFDTEPAPKPELSILLQPGRISAAWPLPLNQYRWSFQTEPVEALDEELPAKDRRPLRFFEEKTDQEHRQQLRQLLAERAPWFKASVGKLRWSLRIQFGSRLARKFGQGRCWLAGDAAHQTSPIGIQSMNLGLREADQLSGLLHRIINRKAGLDALAAYNQERLDEWQRMLGRRGEVKPGAKAEAWIKDYAAQILSCIPASGDELNRLLAQAGLQWSA